MDRIKEKVYRKRKLWKIFTLKRPQFLQKMLAIGVSASLMLSMAPKIGVFAENEPDKFITAAKANHWGRSDLRAYLNGVAKENNTLAIDTTTSGSNATGYASQFSNTEYALVQPFTYSTNVLNSEDVAASTYSATDRFWLPSGNSSLGSDQVLSWGATDVSRNFDYAENLPSDRAIPISYWPAGASSHSWLRSPRYGYGNRALRAYRGCAVDYYYVDPFFAAAAAFKLDLSSVIFASAASAASFAAEGGSRKFEIEGSSDFGKKVTAKLPDYGMYLKTTSTDNFAPTGLTYANNHLTVNYTNGVAGQYVVVQAFTDDNLRTGTTSYEAAYQLAAANVGDNKSIDLHVSNWGLASLDGYTIKVWMEDASGGSSLAAATAPVTFVGQSDGSFKAVDDGSEAKNQRVFAMKNDLQTSWGDLQALKASNETAYNNVIAGKGQDGSEGDSTNSIHGLNPTNQKIYFGTAADGSPLEFWIAGRETYAAGKSPTDGDGTIDPNGTIMTLYQAKSVKPTKHFNASYSNYGGNSVALQLADGQTAEYTGSAVAYPEEKITATVTAGTIDKRTLVWQHRAPGATAWNDGMPTAVGTYQLRCYAPGEPDSYERTYSSIVTFNIKYKPKASDFTFTQPADLTYDSNQKTADVTTEQSGMGDITVKYYKEDGDPAVNDTNDATTAPTDVGTYTVKIDVAEGELYAGAEGLDGGWTFTISYLTPPELSGFSTDTGYKDSENLLWFKGGAPASVQPPSGYKISTTLGSGYGGSVTLGETDSKEVYLEDASGHKTDAIDLAGILKWDSDAPTGNIQLSTGNYWTDLINKISFGLFFKDTKTATITASDSDSGIKPIEYHVATDGDLATKDTDESAIKIALEGLPTGASGWQTYSVPISLIEKSKNVVYAKLTDNVGNISYISSNGIVLYSDSATTTSSLDYTKLSGTNPEIKINLNGNTIDEVKLGDTTLTKDTDYSISTQGDAATISLVASKLDKKTAGNYTVKVTFNPQGEEFVEDTDNVAPTDVDVTLTIKRATPQTSDFTFSPPTNLTYNGEKKEAAVNGQEGMGDITVKYYDEDGTLVVDTDSGAACAPKDVGTYTVKIDVAEGEIYAGAEGLDDGWTFTIKPATLTVASLNVKPKTYNGTATADVLGVTFSGLVTPPGGTQETLALGTDFTVSDAAFKNANVGTAKKVTATITLKNTAKAKNYTFEGGLTTTSETTADISAFNISSAAVKLADSTLTYTGSALRPGVSSVKVKLKQGDDTQTTLEEGEDKDYTVTYSNNTNAGTATVTITGKGNFNGSKTADFTINKKSLAGATIEIDSSTMVYTGKKLDPTITSVTVDGVTVPSDAYDMTVSGETQAGKTVTVTLAAKSNSNFKGSSKTAFTVTKAAPGTSDLKPTPSLTATYGQTLGDIKAGLASAIGSFLGVDRTALEGDWLWSDDAATKVGNVGTNTFTALFAPEDTNNYDWTTLDGWNDTLGALAVDVAVNVSVDTSKWGEAQKRDADGKTQYVDSADKTSIELTEGNLGDGDILWLFEESYGKSAWYGIDLSSGAFDLDTGLRFYVQWLSPTDPEYNTYYSQLDDAQKARVEGDNGWIFLIGVEDPDGKKVPPAHPVNVYVQLGDPNEGADWDLAHLKAYYITSGGDENVPVEDVTNFAYPGGTDEFGMMTLSHFSPYFIFDELTDEERAALTPTPNDNNNRPTDKPDSSGTDLPGTGDIATTLFFAGLAIVLVSSLGVMLRLITSKKKFEK